MEKLTEKELRAKTIKRVSEFIENNNNNFEAGKAAFMRIFEEALARGIRMNRQEVIDRRTAEIEIAKNLTPETLSGKEKNNA